MVFRHSIARLATAAAATTLALAGAQLAGGSVAHAGTVHPHVVTVVYDAGKAGDLKADVDKAAQIWNASVKNVKFQAGTGNAKVTVTRVTGGGSYTETSGLGAGAVYLDSDQAKQYDPVRIAAHEFGHIYGLPDNYNGDCGILMSGHSAGTSCKTEKPSAAEAAQVDKNFAGGGSAVRQRRVYRDCFPVTRAAA